MLRLVLDTDVIIAALRSLKGASAQLVASARLGHVELLTSVALTLEYEEVCHRHEHVSAAGVNRADVDNFLEVLANIATPVPIRYQWQPQLNDPDDEMVLAAAINGHADAIVTFNIRHYHPAKRFGIEVINPGDILRRLRQ